MDLIQFLDDFDELHDYDQIPRRVVIDRIDPLHVYDDIKFYQRYRMRKESAIDLIRLLEADLQRPTKRSSAIPTSLQVLATVRFMGTGKFQREDADLHGISQPSMSRIVHDVLESMARLREEFIKFPTEEEYYVISNRFREHRGFPGVIGAVDCTHIRIKNPGGNDAELFRNRKGWMSINTQVVCDDKLIIRDIVASHRGSAHDARIFNESTLRHRLEQLPHEFHILGEECINMPHMVKRCDKGYPCRVYLLTPLVNPTTLAERTYNYAQSSTRTVIERLFGIMKRRFPCLTKTLNYKPEKCCIAIVACAVLHNFLTIRNDNVEPIEEAYDADEDDYLRQDYNDAHGATKRRRIIQNVFT